MQISPAGRLRRLSALCALALLAATPSWADQPKTPLVPKYDLYEDTIQAIHARQGMVASEHRLATDIGVAVLKQGGNAVDAAVAVGFAQAVVFPAAGNIGGGGFMVIHEAKTGRNIAIDFREIAPGRASRDMYLDDKGEVVPKRSTATHLAVGVPGTVAGMLHALNKYGSMKLADLLKPSIELARRGFVVTPHLAAQLAANRDHLGQWPSSRKIFFKDDRPLQAGELLVQTDLADSLQLIAERGASAFYTGSIAEKIAADMARHGGLIGKDDLKRYQVMEREPVSGEYRGYRIVSMPPPSSGGTHIVQLLNMLSHYPLREYGAGSARTIHIQAEAMKLAYADRSEYLGDPDFTKVPVKGLTSPAYAAELIKQIDPERARPAGEIKPGRPQPYEGDQTTHYSVADRHGNVVSTTYTLNLGFGSGIVAEGTGILLNNEMDDFSAKPGVPNAFGLIGGDANAVAPYKRPLSSMSPTIVLKDGKPWLVTGSPGGSRIITTTLQTIIDAVDFDMNPAQAAITPRIHHQWLPDELWVERGVSPDTLQRLKDKGHKVVPKRAFGVTQTIRVTPEGFYGYSDPRGPDGGTAGY